METIMAALQLRPPKGRPREARARLVAAFEEAGRWGARLAVAPEMATAGYVWPYPHLVAPHAEPADGPTAAALAPIARRYGMWIVCGYPELHEGALYNAALVIDEGGAVVGSYRKNALYNLDELWAQPGDTRLILPTPFGSLAVGICRDIVDDGFCDWVRAQAPAVVAFPASWIPGSGEDPHAYWQGRLAGYPGLLIAANTWGTDQGITSSGRSAILGPRGVLSHAPAQGDAIITASLVGHA